MKFQFLYFLALGNASMSLWSHKLSVCGEDLWEQEGHRSVLLFEKETLKLSVSNTTYYSLKWPEIVENQLVKGK